MQIVWNCLILIVGFAALIKGADYFVDGSAAIARFFKVPGVIIGLTIVSMGTSAPELAVSVSAGLAGSNAIAVSNVVGSNLFNLLAVLGICAIMRPLPVDTGIKRRDFPISMAATLLVILFAGNLVLSGRSPDLADSAAAAGKLFRWNGLVLVVCFLLYLVYTVRMAKRNRLEKEKEEPVVLWKSVLFIILGLAAIIIGGQLVVNSARALALAWGMSETLVGLTIVAIGTSLPELVTSIVASSKGENGMAIGNVVGSNIFNLLLILGVSSSLHPIQVSMASFVDLGVLLGMSMIAYGFVCSGKRINRIEGVFMTALYIGYTIFAILR